MEALKSSVFRDDDIRATGNGGAELHGRAWRDQRFTFALLKPQPGRIVFGACQNLIGDGAWHHDLTQSRQTAKLARFAQKNQR